ncbi:D-amino-acid dehydrogenase [Loktanella fryxellensis]|uniref:D-amino-acid dehydrogenase n=1 Tax=Loktanella fryxellensis TaxID=245187 RepID=A0A1H8HCX3_9RHOB|nr:FAD-dependent oxidoreductase [Loktanella fryxellensis]SEN53819.1 D-amino-acid dehydrogenase [Loktanella fryxellensis]
MSDIVVIGAGVVGVTTALALQTEGHSVRLIDRGEVGMATSRGNAGAFAFADIEPLATPGVMRRAPRFLLDPLGPLSIPPAQAVRMIPWLWRFWRASRPQRHAAAVAAQASLMDISRTALDDLIAAVNGEPLMRREGQLQLYEGEPAFRASLPGWDLRRAHGVAFDLLDGAEAITEIQPGLSPRFTHAGFVPAWMNTTDPFAWVQHLAQAFVARGGTIARHYVQALVHGADGVTVKTATGPLTGARVVVAAGAWSHQLARTLGDRVPLDTERGYNATFAAGGTALHTHLTFPDHGFVVTRIGDGVRVGGAVELGGLDRAPDWRRADVLADKARAFLPLLTLRDGVRWMGCRPSTPDSLPMIGHAPRSDRVTYAFGHGHLGLTQAAGTAQLVADLVAGRAPGIDLTPFAATRFR